MLFQAMLAVMLMHSDVSPPIKPPIKGEVAAREIRSLRPSISVKRSWSIGWLVEHYAAKYDLDPHLIIAILRQESNFDSGIKSCWDKTKPDGTPYKTCDLGIAQINEGWIKTWDLDEDKNNG